MKKEMRHFPGKALLISTSTPCANWLLRAVSSCALARQVTVLLKMIGGQQIKDRLATRQRWPALDALLAQAQPNQPLAVRVAWLEDLLTWLRRDVPATRLRLLLQLLDRQPDAHQRLALTLRTIVRDTEALDLFADTGLPQGAGFLSELFSRAMAGVLPDSPATRDLADIFDRLGIFEHRGLAIPAHGHDRRR